MKPALKGRSIWRGLACAGLFALASGAAHADGLVGAWGLNGAFGTTEADYSGNGNRGTLNGPVLQTTAGKFGNAVVFSGGGSGVRLGTPATLQLSGSMTLSAWINSSDFPSGDAAIVSSLDGGGFQLDITADTGPRTIGFRLVAPNGADMVRYGATAIPLGQWVHVTGVYDAQAQTMNVYLNGVLDNGTLSGTVASSHQISGSGVRIGDSNIWGFGFIGTIDEVRIYNRALTQADVQTDMNSAIAPSAPDTQAPTAPSGVTATPVSSNGITVAWTGASDNFDVVRYSIERCAGSGCANFAEVGTTITTTFADAGLALVSSYSYRTRAADQSGNLSAYSAVVSATTLSYQPGTGRVGSYAFDEGSGTTTADSSGLGNTGALVAGAAWATPGKFGNAIVFPGGGSGVNLGTPATLQLSGSMTLSAWINSSDFPSGDAAIVSSLDASGFQLDTTVDTGPRTIGFRLVAPNGADMVRYGATTIPLGQWVHVTGVYDAQAQTMNVYFNGALDNGTLSGTVASSHLISGSSVRIGDSNDWGFGFIGTIDEVRIYNRALTQAEVQADMAVSVNATPADVFQPSAPTDLSAVAASATQINLGWTPSSDNVGVTGYRVERCQGAGCSNFAQIATPAGASFADTGLTGSTSYSYRVRATDAAGNLSGYSGVASATTAAGGGVQTQMYFIEPDHLNTPRMIASASGVTVWRWDQTEPFGDSLPNADADGDGIPFDFPLRFPGQYFDRETNLAYNVFRDYDSNTGRYVESDPIGLKGGINTYGYVTSSPLKRTDPTGLTAFLFQWGPGGGIGYLIFGYSKYQLKVMDPIKGRTCKYTVTCYGLGVGLPEFGWNSPVEKWDDGEKCSACDKFAGIGSQVFASAMIGIGVSLRGMLDVPNGPNLTSGEHLINFDGGAFRIGTGGSFCSFTYDGG